MPKSILFLLAIILGGCSYPETGEIPERFQDLTNLIVIPADTQPEKSIQTKLDISYGTTNDVLINQIGSIAVDDSGQVYFTGGGAHVINVFDPNGRFLTHIGRKGQGPGEFSSTHPGIHIFSNRIYAIDLFSYRVSVFSVDSFELIRTLKINLKNKSKVLADHYIHQIIPNKNGTFLVDFKKFLRDVSDLPEGTKIDTLNRRYYTMDKEGKLIPRQVLKIQDQPVVNASFLDMVGPISFHFFDRPLVSVSNDGSIYATNSKDFLIKVYSPGGEYLRAFFHPYQNVPLTTENALESSRADMSKWELMAGEDMKMIQTIINSRQRSIRQIDLPPTWPALNDLLVDDENRLWVSTIVEDFDVYEWWVLEETGELITKFEWPRDEPIEVVKNGYMYTRQTDEETGLQAIVRYRIELEEV